MRSQRSRWDATALTGIARLASALSAKAVEGGALERLARTCLQDAVPTTVAATHRGHAHAVGRTAAALARSLDELLAVPLGATAVGTGIGSPAGYRERVLPLLAEESGLAVTGAGDLADALSNLDAYVDVAAQVVRVAIVTGKIAADLRLLSSGPVGGIGEVRLPAVQVGSSIMPGKVNPVMPELMLQIGYEAKGMFTIVEAAAAGGELDLNVMEPVIAKHLLASLHDLGVASELFATRCIDGLEWNEERVAANLAGSLARRSRNRRREPQPLKTLTSSGLIRSGAVQPSRSYSDMHWSTKPLMRSTVPSPFAIQ